MGSGRKFKLDFNNVKARVKTVPFSLQKSLCSLSPQIGIPYMTLYCYLKLSGFGQEWERRQADIDTREQGCQGGVLPQVC